MKIRNEVKIGILVIIAIAVLLWGINFLNGKSLFAHTKTYYAVFENVDGLKLSAHVVVSGVKVGQVNTITLIKGNSGDALVEFYVEKGFDIYKGTVAQLNSVDLFGTKVINLLLSESESLHMANDTLMSEEKTDMTEDMMSVKDKAENIIVTLDSAIQNTLSKHAIKSLHSAIRNIEMLTSSLNATMGSGGEMNETIRNMNLISENIKNNNKQIAAIIQNMGTISDSLATSEIKSVIDNSNKAIKSLAEVINKINSDEGTIGKLMNSDSIHNNLLQVSRDLDMLLKDMKENPNRYVHFSLFGKKDK